MEPQLAVRVTVPGLTDEDRRSRLARRLTDGLRALAGSYGLGLTPSVVIDARPEPYLASALMIVTSVGLQVDGREVGQSLDTALRVTSAMPPSPLRRTFLPSAARAGQATGDGPDDVTARAESVAVDVVLGTFRRRPQLMATEAVARAWWDALPVNRFRQSSGRPEQVLGRLLAAGVGADLEGPAMEALALADSAVPGDPEEVALWVLGQVRTEPQLVLHLPAAMAAELLGVPDPPNRLSIEDDRVPALMRQSWSGCVSEIGTRTGLLVPALHLETSEALPGTVSVGIRRRMLEPVPMPGPGECWRATDPAGDGTLAYISARAAGTICSSDGGGGIEPAELLPQIVMAEILAAPELLVDIEQIAYRLAQIEDSYPDLVDRALARLPIPALTVLVRRLAAQGVYPCDLLYVLDGVVSADVVRTDRPGMVALDTRALVAGSEPAWRPFLDPLRRALVDQLPVAGPVEHLPSPLADELAAGIASEELWDLVRQVRSAGTTLVTEDLVRERVAEELSGVDPALPVLSRYEAAIHPALSRATADPSAARESPIREHP